MENSTHRSKSEKSWDYRLSKKALKNLKKIPIADQRKIFETLESMKSEPFAGDAKPIQGEENLHRRRVGNYRIYFRPLFEYKILDVPEIIRKQSH